MLPVFPSDPRCFLLDLFLFDVGVNFDLVILKTEALGLTPIVELIFNYYLPVSLQS